MSRLVAIGVMVILVSLVLTLIIYAIQAKSAGSTHPLRHTLSVAFHFEHVLLQNGLPVAVQGMIEVLVRETAVSDDPVVLKALTSEIVETAVRNIAAHKTNSELQQNPSILSLKIREASQDALAQKGLAIVSLVVKNIV